MKLRNLLIVSVALFGLISCDKSEDMGSSSLPSDGIVRVSAGVNSLTRAGAESDNLTEFGMFVTPLISSDFTYTNVHATKKNNAWKTDKVMLWKNDAATVGIVAYSPYNADFITLDAESPVSVKQDQSISDNVIASDFLYAKSDVTPNSPVITNDIYYNNNEKAVMVTLGHKFSKLLLEIVLSPEFNYLPTNINPIDKILILGTNTSTTVKLADCTIATATEIENITPFEESYTSDEMQKTSTANYQAIIIPQVVSVGDLSISFNIGVVSYKWISATGLTFVGGKSHYLKLDVGDGIVTSSGMTVGDWGDTDDKNIITD